MVIEQILTIPFYNMGPGPVSQGTHVLPVRFGQDRMWAAGVRWLAWMSNNQGDRMSLQKNRPKCGPAIFFQMNI
jgi:hypothetical protein